MGVRCNQLRTEFFRHRMDERISHWQFMLNAENRGREGNFLVDRNDSVPKSV